MPTPTTNWLKISVSSAAPNSQCAAIRRSLMAYSLTDSSWRFMARRNTHFSVKTDFFSTKCFVNFSCASLSVSVSSGF
ncbi:hypothetical protein BpHYR1_037747, partial [Brachionus plicatilis]